MKGGAVTVLWRVVSSYQQRTAHRVHQQHQQGQITDRDASPLVVWVVRSGKC